MQNIPENVNNQNVIDSIDWEDAMKEVDEFLEESSDNTSNSEDTSKDKMYLFF